jgi:integrase
MERFVNSRQDSMRSPLAEYAVIVRLLMLLGCRWAEIGALRRTEIEIDPDGGKGVLHIKGKRTKERRGTKNKRDLVLPLPPMAIDVIKSIPHRPDRDFLFGIGPKGLLDNGIFKERLDARIAEIDGQPIKPWRHHDFRHSITTHMNEMFIDDRIVETITNHRSGIALVGGERTIGHKAGIAGRYNHATYKGPVWQALDRWARAIRNAADRVEVEPDTNVMHADFGKRSA